MLTEYKFHDYRWIGPLLPNWSSSLITQVPVTTSQIDQSPNQSSNKVVFVPRETEFYVVVSTYLTQDEFVLGFPTTFEECFRTIMEAIQAEAETCPNDSYSVKACCENHRILPVILNH